jgi:hypothetical protein
MTQEQVTDGNKLIALFDGWEEGRYATLPDMLYRNTDEGEISISVNNLTFDTDWNELMPVWFKIMELNKEEFGIYYNQEITIEGLLFKDKFNIGFNHVSKFPMYGTCNYLLDTYAAVIEFVKWYNNHTH